VTEVMRAIRYLAGYVAAQAVGVAVPSPVDVAEATGRSRASAYRDFAALRRIAGGPDDGRCR